MDQLDFLVSIAADMATAPCAADRNRSLLAALRRVVPCDAAALLRLDGDALVPESAQGLSPSALGRRYVLREHPRLDVICRSEAPVLFPPDTAMPDPFDGMLLEDPHALRRIHACLGTSLRLHGEVVGALTADALDPHAFQGLDTRLLTAAGALAAAELRTTQLIAALTRTAERQGHIARDLVRDALVMQGNHIIGTSGEVARLRREIDLVARSDFTVLVTGETGVGKELVARAVHNASGRRDQPLIYVNCAALPETLAESELFGHVKGAFTGAGTDRLGKFEVADGGTLFLDEVGELALSVQPKLLRVIQEGEIQRVGSDRPASVNVRLLVATNRDLGEEVKAGRFRADLFHRLNVYPLAVPPLRARRADIPLLAGYFCDLARRRLGLGPVRLTADALDALEGYPWPGNVRELENLLARVVLRTSGGVRRGDPVVVTSAHLSPDLTGGAPPPLTSVDPDHVAHQGKGSLREYQRAQQRSFLQRALAENGGNVAATARAVGMDRGNLYHALQRLGLVRPRVAKR
jgi:anaerobic nitric oxide reductase transcription regulator